MATTTKKIKVLSFIQLALYAIAVWIIYRADQAPDAGFGAGLIVLPLMALFLLLEVVNIFLFARYLRARQAGNAKVDYLVLGLILGVIVLAALFYTISGWMDTHISAA